MRFTRFSLIAVATSATLAFSLSGCTNAAEESKTTNAGEQSTSQLPTEKIDAFQVDSTLQALLPATVKEAGVLRIATDPTYAPFEVYADDNKTIVGLDVDLAHSMSELLGLKVEFVAASFDSIIPGLSSGKYDLAMSAFSVTEERKANADFVVYHQSGSGVAVPAGNPNKLSMDPLSLCGHTLGAEKGTTQGMEILPEFNDLCKAEGKEAIDIQLFPSSSEAITALSSKRVEGVVSGTTGLGYQAKITGAFELADGPDYAAKPTGLILPKGSELTPAITATVEKLVDSQQYEKTFSKWGLSKNDEVDAKQVAVN